MLTNDNYEDAVLTAVNLGEDTDTTGDVAGGLAPYIMVLKIYLITESSNWQDKPISLIWRIGLTVNNNFTHKDYEPS